MTNKYFDEAQQIHDDLFGPEGAVPSVRAALDDLDVVRLALETKKAAKYLPDGSLRSAIEQKHQQEAAATLRAAQATVAAAVKRADELKQYFDPNGYAEDAWHTPRPAPIRTTWVSEVLRKHVAEEEGRPMETDEDTRQAIAELRAGDRRRLVCDKLARASDKAFELEVKAVVARVEKDGGTEADAALLRDMRDEADRNRTSDKLGYLRGYIRDAIAKLKLPAGMREGAELIAKIARAPRLIEVVGRQMAYSPTHQKRKDQGDPIGNAEYMRAGGTAEGWGEKVKADAAALQQRAEEAADRLIMGAVQADLKEPAGAAAEAAGAGESTIH